MHSNEIILWEHEVIVLWGTFTTVVKALIVIANRTDSGSDTAPSLQPGRRNRFIRDARCCVRGNPYGVEEQDFTLFVNAGYWAGRHKKNIGNKSRMLGNAVLEVQR